MSQTITSRIISVRRHTVGYVVGQEEMTRSQAVKLARKGLIAGVRVCKGPNGPYLSSSTRTALYSLPTRLRTKKTRSRSSR